jgi:hypothetical protein
LLARDRYDSPRRTGGDTDEETAEVALERIAALTTSPIRALQLRLLGGAGP